jgi:hypothetical protein
MASINRVGIVFMVAIAVGWVLGNYWLSFVRADVSRVGCELLSGAAVHWPARAYGSEYA